MPASNTFLSKTYVIRWGYLGVFILFLLTYILGFYNNRKLIDQSNLVSHTYKVVNNVDLFVSHLYQMESVTRGYIITGDKTSFNPTLVTSSEIDNIYNDLKQLTGNHVEQQAKLQKLHDLTEEKKEFTLDLVRIFEDNNLKIADTITKTRKGKLLMDEIRDISEDIKNGEYRLLNQRDKEVNRTSQIIMIINMISLLIAVTLIFYSVLNYYRESMARKVADNKAENYHKELEVRVEELDKLNKQLGELKNIEKFALTGRISRTIAHEVRNPLTNINLAIEQLKSELPPNNEYEMLLEMVSRNANRINSLITDLLNSTKTNLLTFEFKNISDLLDETLEFAQDRIELKNIKVVKNYMQHGCMLNVDPEKIKIAFLNIIINAIEAMKAGEGELLITTQNVNERCKVTIQDNGSGISQESLSKLFEPYFTTKPNGTGLGLTNTQNIILSHNASLVAESEEGKGTVFTVTFDMG
ncbi:hypothetical protein BH09BAC2_BH09BAC2_06970 [soil metagenome]